MLSTIMTAVMTQLPGSTVEGCVVSREDLIDEIGNSGADVVVLQDDHPSNAHSFGPLLRRFPKLRVVAITADGSSGYLHELRPCPTFLAEMSVSALQAALQDDQDRITN